MYVCSTDMWLRIDSQEASSGQLIHSVQHMLRWFLLVMMMIRVPDSVQWILYWHMNKLKFLQTPNCLSACTVLLLGSRRPASQAHASEGFAYFAEINQVVDSSKGLQVWLVLTMTMETVMMGSALTMPLLQRHMTQHFEELHEMWQPDKGTTVKCDWQQGRRE